jgi:hypothetical protein
MRSSVVPIVVLAFHAGACGRDARAPVGSGAGTHPSADTAEFLRPPSQGTPDPRIPFAPTAADPAVPHPCGRRTKGPCLLLARGSLNYRPFQAAWLMDTAGDEYTLSWNDRTDAIAETMNHILKDGSATQQDFARAMAAAKARPPRVSASDIRHVLSLLSASKTAVTVHGGPSPCRDGTPYGLSGYLFDPTRRAFLRLFLQGEICNTIEDERISPSARELAQWVNILLEKALPVR